MAMSREAARFIVDLVKDKPDSLFCFAAGDTPLGTFSFLVEAAIQKDVSFDLCHFVSLDEWVGLGADDAGSCRQTLDAHFFNKLAIEQSNIHFFNGNSDDLEKECRQMNDFIQLCGPIDFLLLGLGMNGHLGFNEPGASMDAESHVIQLDATTKKVSVKYFQEAKPVQQGITLGMKQITEARTVMLIADGLHKADIILQSMQQSVTNRVPASLLRNHPDAHLYLDEKAASKLH